MTMERQGRRAAARMAEVAEARPGHSPLAGNETLAVIMEEYIHKCPLAQVCTYE